MYPDLDVFKIVMTMLLYPLQISQLGVCDLLLFFPPLKSSHSRILSPWTIPSTSHSMQLYCLSALDRILLQNAVAHITVLSGVASQVPSLTCSPPPLHPLPDVSVSKYKGFLVF